MSTTPGIDEAGESRLIALLQKSDLPIAADDFSVQLISGGRSNITYRLRSGDSSWVLRRPPLGHVLSTAHDMGREFRVLSALGSTAIPVPATVLLCSDTAVIGTPFYVMEYIPGDVLRTASQALTLSESDQAGVASHLTDVLADVHQIAPEDVGLADFGKPDGFMNRQVRRWTQQLDDSRSRELPGIDGLARTLAKTVPPQRYSSIVHGDYRLDNCLVRGGSVAAVLDWEMSTLGDPLADLGLFSVYYSGLAGIDNPVVQALEGLGAFPRFNDLLERYAARTDRDLVDLDWYIAFAWFKFAVILEGIHYRSTLGRTVGDGFEGVASLVQTAVDHGWAALREGASE